MNRNLHQLVVTIYRTNFDAEETVDKAAISFITTIKFPLYWPAMSCICPAKFTFEWTEPVLNIHEWDISYVPLSTQRLFQISQIVPWSIHKNRSK